MYAKFFYSVWHGMKIPDTTIYVCDFFYLGSVSVLSFAPKNLGKSDYSSKSLSDRDVSGYIHYDSPGTLFFISNCSEDAVIYYRSSYFLYMGT